MGSRTAHHPSARNGLHEWLNRMATTVAHEHGVGVLDLSDLTIEHPPPPKRVHRAGEGAAAGRRLATETTEGDLYHGFNSTLLLLPFVERACRLCHVSA